MSDEVIEQSVETDAIEVLGADRLLQLMTSMANSGLRFSVTLFVKGTVISGDLIGQRPYLEEFIAGFTVSMDEELREHMRDAFGLNDPEPADEDRPLAAEIQYIHLSNAQVFAPGQPPLPQNGLLWRGKMADVDGFSLGRFENRPA